MSDNYSLIIKNGSCYINGKLIKTDLGLSGKKIKKIGKIELNSSKVFDATNPDTEYFTAEAVFKYAIYNVTDATGNRL